MSIERLKAVLDAAMPLAVRVLVFAAGLALLITGGTLATLDRTASAAVCMGAAFLCLIFVFLAQFKTFQGFGIKAELWEDKQREAAALIEAMKPMLVGTAKLMVKLATNMGYLDSALSRRERYEAVRSIDQLLAQLGISPEMAQVKAEFHWRAQIELAGPAVESLRRLLDARSAEIREAMQRFQQPIQADDPEWNRLANDNARVNEEIAAVRKLYKIEPIEDLEPALQRQVRSMIGITEDAKTKFLADHAEVLEDLRHYASTKQFRRLGVWMTGDA